MSWVTMTKVIPHSRLRVVMRDSIVLVAVGSSDAVGSSIRRTSGSLARARAMQTRCCSPTESLSASRSANSGVRATDSSSDSTSIGDRCPASLHSPLVSPSPPSALSVCAPSHMEGPARILSRIVPGKRMGTWNTMPTLRRSSRGGMSVVRVRSMITSPESGSMSRFRVRRNIDFPDPEGPTIVKILPEGTSTEIESRIILPSSETERS